MKNKQICIIRYGELALKSRQTRPRFEKKLVSNIKSGLGPKHSVKRIFGRLVIDSWDKKVREVLPRVFGIVSFSPCRKTNSGMNQIEKTVLENVKIKKTDTFAVDCNRTGEHPYTSKQVEEKIGAKVVEKFGSKVRLKNPDKTIGIDIRDKEAFIYTEVFRGPGGLPLGTQPRVLALIENRESVTAAWMIMKRGCEIVPLFAGSGSPDKYFKVLEKWGLGPKLKKHKAKTEKEIRKILKEKNCLAIVTGDSGLKKINRFQDLGVPVFMPLVGMGCKVNFPSLHFSVH